MRRLSLQCIVVLTGAALAATAAAQVAPATAQQPALLIPQPWIAALLGIILATYVLGMRRMGAGRRRQTIGRWRCAAFTGGIVTLFIALVCPLAAFSADLFSADMTQHLLLWLVAPPLLVSGRPIVAWRWALTPDRHRTGERGWMRSRLHGLFQVLMRPLMVWLSFSVVLCFWHLPAAYDFAIRHRPVHDLEHLSFLAAALAFWTVVIAPNGRRALGYVATMFFVLSFGFEMSLIGALLTFAPQPLYSVHVHTTATFGLTPLQDQQLAGVLMWTLSNISHLGTLCVLLFAWFREAERREAMAKTVLSTAPLRCALLAPLLLALLAGCGETNPPPQQTTGGDPQHGAALIRHYGCDACHTIPGINGADGVVGPPLNRFGQRMFIAGVLSNRADNLIHWIRFPQSVVPGADMPDMGVTEDDARDIAAYLYTLR